MNKLDQQAVALLRSRIDESPAPIIFFDLETTGVDVKKDRIVSLSAIKMSLNGSVETKSIIVNPTIPIPEGASKVHGITNAMVIDKPPFKSYSLGIQNWFNGCVLAGHNITNYDVPLLRHELYRQGLKIDVLHIIDTMAIEARCSPRNLGFVYNKYTNKVLEDAHNADADTMASMEVFCKMLDFHFRDKPILKIIEDTTDPRKFLDIDRNIYEDSNGVLFWNINPKRDMKIDPKDNFIQWYLSKDFSEDSKNIIKKFVQNQSK